MASSRLGIGAMERCFERADRAGDEHVALAGHVARLAGDLRRAAIEQPCLVGQTKRRQAQPVRAKAVGLDRVRAGFDVFAMDRADQVGPRLDQLVERRPLGQAAAEEQRAHGAIEQQRRTRQPLAERLPLV